MQRLSTTVIALVGEDAERVAQGVEGGLNLRLLPATGDPLTTWSAVVRTRAPYCAILDDPLAEVAAAWTELFEAREATGALEIAVSGVRARIASGALDLPDYYVVAGDAPFHLSALAQAAVHRVVPIGQDMRRTVAGLRAGRWWPAPASLLDALDHRLPDRLSAPVAAPDDMSTGLLTA